MQNVWPRVKSQKIWSCWDSKTLPGSGVPGGARAAVPGGSIPRKEQTGTAPLCNKQQTNK